LRGIHTCVILRSTPIIPMRRHPMPKTVPTTLCRKYAGAEIEVTSDHATTTFAEVSVTR